MAIVAPPRLVGTATVAPLFGVSAWQMRDKVRRRHPAALAGYLGKIGGDHVWNLPELVATLFTSNAAVELVVDRLTDPSPADPLDTILCAAPGCDRVEETVGLCRLHLHRLIAAWDRSSRSTLSTVQLVAMCQWIVERNAHLVLPAGYDPWSTQCMTPECANETNRYGDPGPLCPSCAATFWNNAPTRTRPFFWKRTAA